MNARCRDVIKFQRPPYQSVRCELDLGHAVNHEGDGWRWSDSYGPMFASRVELRRAQPVEPKENT